MFKLRLSLAALALCAFSSCESMSSMTGGSLDQTLQGIQTLASGISTWSGKLQGKPITDTVIQELGNYAGNAGGLGETLQGLLGAADDKTQKKMAPVQSGLKQLSGFQADNLKGLGANERRQEVNKFSAAASDLSGVVGQLLAAGSGS